MIFLAFIFSEYQIIGYISEFNNQTVLYTWMLSILVWSTNIFIVTGKISNAVHERLLDTEGAKMSEDDKEPINKKFNFYLKSMNAFNLPLKRALIINLVAMMTFLLVVIFSYDYTDFGSLSITLLGSALFAIFLLYQAFSLLVPNSNSTT